MECQQSVIATCVKHWYSTTIGTMIGTTIETMIKIEDDRDNERDNEVGSETDYHHLLGHVRPPSLSRSSSRSLSIFIVVPIVVPIVVVGYHMRRLQNPLDNAWPRLTETVRPTKYAQLRKGAACLCVYARRQVLAEPKGFSSAAHENHSHLSIIQ